MGNQPPSLVLKKRGVSWRMSNWTCSGSLIIVRVSFLGNIWSRAPESLSQGYCSAILPGRDGGERRRDWR